MSTQNIFGIEIIVPSTDAQLSRAQESYNLISAENQLTVRFIVNRDTNLITRTAADSSMEGAVRELHGTTYPIATSPALGNIVAFNGAGQVQAYAPITGEIEKGSYSNIIGMAIALHMEEGVYEVINAALAEHGVKAVDVLVNAAPLNLWPKDAGGSVSAKAYAQVVSITPQFLNVTVSGVSIKTVNGEQVRAANALSKANNSSARRSARQGASAPNFGDMSAVSRPIPTVQQ
jgi:hypothetical protein